VFQDRSKYPKRRSFNSRVSLFGRGAAMSRHLSKWIAAMAFVFGAAMASSASAQVVAPYAFGGTLGWPINFYQQETIPYFALHPPVYYSVPVARTYGYSPFAYPPGTMTPDFVGTIEPQTTVNPFAPQSSKAKKGGVQKTPGPDRSASYKPLTIINPYIDSTQLTVVDE
jgi:hypothetical protein